VSLPDKSIDHYRQYFDHSFSDLYLCMFVEATLVYLAHGSGEPPFQLYAVCRGENLVGVVISLFRGSGIVF